MLSLPPAVRIFVATQPTSMHLSFDRLAALAREVLQQDVFHFPCAPAAHVEVDAVDLALLLERCVEEASHGMTPDVVEEAKARGRAMTVADAIAFALEEPSPARA